MADPVESKIARYYTKKDEEEAKTLLPDINIITPPGSACAKCHIPAFDFDGVVFSRSEEKRTVLSAIREMCSSKEVEAPVSIFVITGPQGVGKTAFLATLLNEEEECLSTSRISMVLWFESLEQNKKKSFYLHLYRELVRVGVLNMPQENSGWERKPRHLGKFIDLAFKDFNILIVLDKVKHVQQTTENILRLQSSTAKFVMLVTQPEAMQPNSKLFKTLHVNTLPFGEAQEVLRGISLYKSKQQSLVLDKFFSMLDRFYDITSGFSYITDVLIRVLAKFKQPEIAENLLDILEPMPSSLKKTRQVEVSLYRLVYRLLSEEFERNVAKQYLFCLLFNPCSYMDQGDLALLWRCDRTLVPDIVERFRVSGLIQRVQKDGAEFFMVPLCVHVAATRCASRLEIAASLADLRAKAIDAELLRRAVDRRKEQLLKQIASNLDARTLAELCRNQTKFGHQGTGFLHYLYNTDWPDTERRKVPFRLVAKFLRNLKSARVNICEILTLHDRDCECLLLLITKNNARDASPDHRLLYEIVSTSATFNTQINLARDRKYWYNEARDGAETNNPLITAIIKGDLRTVVSYLASPDCYYFLHENDLRCRNGATPLIAASANGHEEILRLLLPFELDVVNEVDKCGSSALIEASYFGHRNVVEILLGEQSQANVNAQNLPGVNALMAAAQHGHLEIVRLLTTHGANVELRNEIGATALIVAAQNGHFNVVEFLLANGANPNVKTNSGTLAIITACQNGFPEIVELLWNYQKDFLFQNERDQNGNTALMIAAQNGHKEVVELIALRSPNSAMLINAKNESGAHALMMAIQSGHLEIAESLLVSFGAEVNLATNKGVTPLMLAALIGDIESMKLILTHQADVRAKDEKGVTALMLASMKGHYNAAKRLIENNADVDGKDNSGVTCLMAACLEGWVDIVELLLKIGAGVNARNNSGGNALIAAAMGGNFDIVRMLLNNPAKADINAAANDGVTALMIAAGCGHLDIVDYLLDMSNKKHNLINRRNKNGETALTFAVKHGHSDVEKFLISRGGQDGNADKVQAQGSNSK